MNTYCISRTAYKTYASVKRDGDSEFTPLVDIWSAPPAYGDAAWKNVEDMRKLRTDLGVEDQGRCFVSYRYDARLPHEADEIKAAMEEAGFPNVHMVADVDAVMAYYQHESANQDLVKEDAGVIVISIRSYYNGFDSGPSAILSATLCRKDFKETISTMLYENEEILFYDIPEYFFESLRENWGDVSVVMYHGYYGMCDEMLSCLGKYFPKAEICATWAEIEEASKQNMQRGMEYLYPRLERSRCIIDGWNRCTCADECGDDEDAQNLIQVLDDRFRKSILSEIKHLSDVGIYVYDILAKWACREKIRRAGSDKEYALKKDNLYPEMKTELHIGLHNRKERFEGQILRSVSKDILGDIQDFLGISDLPLTADEIYPKLPGIFEAVFSSDTEKLLAEKLESWWSKRFFLLEDGVFTNRRKQILTYEDSFKNTRIECRKSTLRTLLDDVIHIKRLRARFIVAILKVLGTKLHCDLLGQFSPAMVEYDQIPKLLEIPDETMVNRTCRGGLKTGLSWDDEKDSFAPVRTSAICEPASSSDSGPVGDNYFEDINGTITYWWEYID